MGKIILDFSENKNAYMPSKQIVDAYKKAVGVIHKYPDYKNTDINQSIATFFDVDFDSVTITNGSIEGINILGRVTEGRKAALFVPTFWGYEDALKRCKYNVEKIGLKDNLTYELEKISRVASEVDLLFLCNPNNPTLSCIDKYLLLEIIRRNPSCHFVIDETMLMFATDFEKMTLSKEASSVENMSVISSFSKIFGLAGVRTGSLISNPDRIKTIKETLVPYSVGSIVQQVLPVALEGREYLDETRRKIADNRERLCEDITNLDGYEVISGVTNFVLVKLPVGVDASELTKHLHLSDMIVRDINESYPLLSGNWIRVSVGLPKDNKKLVKSIREYHKK